jgi:hypothetical protein
MKRWIVISLFITVVIAVTMSCLPGSKGEEVMVFPNWKKHYNLTPDIIESDGHNAYVRIYLNEKAKDAYINVEPRFKEGSKVFKPLYADPEGKFFARLVIMVKMYEGYDSDNGDWWYGVYDESGTKMWYEGRIPECIDCHAMAKETDYLFARSVMKKLNGIDTNEFEEYLEDK